MDINFHRHKPHDVEVGSLCALTVIVPEEALHLVKTEHRHFGEHAIETSIGVFEITLVDAVEHNDTIGGEDDACAFDAKFAQRELHLSVALQTEGAAHTLVDGACLQIGSYFCRYCQRFVRTISLIATQRRATCKHRRATEQYRHECQERKYLFH